MKRVFLIIISCIFLLSSINTLALAYNDKSLIITDCIEDSWIVDVKGEDFFIKDSVDKKFYNQSDTYDIAYNCYQFLDKAQKIIYDSVLANPGKLSFTINFDNGVFPYSNYKTDFFTVVMHALCTDRPDLFYYAGYSIKSGTLYSGRSYVKSLEYVISVYDATIYTDSVLPGYYSALMDKVPQVPVNKTNRFAFVKSVHDYLANTVYYPNLNTSDYVLSAHDAYGALVEGRAVCQGYSDAFKLICDYYKIPCVCISGTSDGVGHMWNAVQMDDGYWYLLDATWDDQTDSNGIFYDFFLVGLNTKDTYFGGEAFSTSHVNDADLFLPQLNYAVNKYSQVNHNTAFKATYNSMTKNNKYLIRSFFDAGDTLVYYNGMYIETDGITTNDIFKAPSGSNNASMNWTMVLIGDCDDNLDGKSNYNDYHAAVDMVLEDKKVTTAREMAADADCDGVLDVIDLALIERAVSGSNTDIKIE